MLQKRIYGLIIFIVAILIAYRFNTESKSTMDDNSTDETLWISAEKGEELLRRTGKDCDSKSHIICPLVLDWWNMKHYNYRGFELCYYGRFGDESDFEEQIKSIPPPPPYNHFA